MSKKKERRRLFELQREDQLAAGLHTKENCLICPLCWGEVEFDRPLTIEHAIPEAVGGKIRDFLTCQSCNNNQGSWYDSHLKDYRVALDAYLGKDCFIGVMTIANNSVPVYVTADAKMVDMKVIEDHEDFDPLASKAVMDALKSGVDKFNLSLTLYNKSMMRVAILRAAYLVAFKQWGYEYAKQPEVQVIREKIMNPDMTHPSLDPLVIETWKFHGQRANEDRPYISLKFNVDGVDKFIFVIFQIKRQDSSYVAACLPCPGIGFEEFYKAVDLFKQQHEDKPTTMIVEGAI